MSRSVTKILCASAIAMSMVGVAGAASKSKHTVEQSPETKVQFVSNAPLENFTGSSSALRGQLTVDAANLGATKGSIELDASTLKTGVELRDEHLCNADWLDCKTNPKIKFTIDKVTGAKAIKPGESVDVEVKGKLSLHGVTRPETATAQVTATKDGLKIKAKLKINIQTYDVSVSAPVRLKVSDDIEINVMLKTKG